MYLIGIIGTFDDRKPILQQLIVKSAVICLLRKEYTMNEDKFTGKAQIYSQFRPGYPAEFIDYLYTATGFRDSSTIADIGSGTGIFSKYLLLKNSTVFGVEPNDDMRSTAGKDLSRFKNYRLVKASAEHTGLPDSFVDFITVAQAFHWFDRAAFRSECRRVLKEGGKVVLVWNIREETNNLVLENDRINKKYCKDYHGFSSGYGGEMPEAYSDFFKGGICEYKTFRHEICSDLDGFIGRNLSSSYAPDEGTEDYAGYIRELSELFIKYSRGGEVQFPYITKSYVGEV